MGDLIGAILAPLFAAIGSLIAAILAPVFELLAVIIGAILHFILALVANLLGASWLALHHKGFKRFGYGLMALTSAHLLAGIALPIFSIGAATLLSWAFSPLMMLISLVLLLLSAILVLATQEASPEHEKRKAKSAPPQPQSAPVAASPVQTAPLQSSSIHAARELVTHGMIILFGLALMLGILSFGAAQTERKSLRDRLCDSALAKYEETVSETWRSRAKKALAFGEEHLGDRLRSKYPCPSRD